MKRFSQTIALTSIVSLIVLDVCAETERDAPPANAASEDEGFLPLGVYWPGEYTFRELGEPEARWAKIDEVLESLAKRNVNTIWLTHTSAADAAEFSRRGAKRGIRLVASIGHLAGEVPHIRNGNHARLIQGTREAWKDAPPPVAFGLGDEPRTRYMHEMADYAAAWRGTDLPTTFVAMAGDMPSAIALVDLTYYCTDIYPYFSPNNPNGPDNHAESVNYLLDAGRRVHARVNRLRPGREWWYMGQIFQEVWGPHDLDDQGNVIFLSGGGPHFRMPTPAEVCWQNWGALACGARGIIHFALFLPGKGKPDAKPLPPKFPFGVKEKTNCGLPRAILYPDGCPTPQFEAMGESFGRIARIAETIGKIEPADEPVAFHSKGWPEPGDVVQPFRGPDDSWYAIVINGNIEKAATVPVNVAGDATGANDLVTGASVPLTTREVHSFEPIGKPFKQLRISLEPGQGTLIRILRDEPVRRRDGPVTVPHVSGEPRPDLPLVELPNGRRPVQYVEDFSDPARFLTHAIRNRGVKHYKQYRGVSALTGGPGGGSLVYDMHTLLPGLGQGTELTLVYSGAGYDAGRFMRGPHWDTSPDGKTWKEFSHGQYLVPVTFRERYLRVRIGWEQGANPGYGCLRGFIIRERRARARAVASPAPKGEEPTADPVETPAQRRKDFVPLGVYWPGEYVFRDEAREGRVIDWAQTEAALDDLAKQGVNAVWLTHRSASDTAEFARRAAKRGIYLVASIAGLAGEVPHIRKGDHQALVGRTIEAWGDAPPPIAWGLGDEPRRAYMDEMVKYVGAWREHAPGEPVTSVVMWGDVRAATECSFDALCCDVYPFFSRGNPHGFGMSPGRAWLTNTQNVVQRSERPWMMGQGFQEARGPTDRDEQGNIIYLPGAAPHWQMPTPEEVRWQAWSAVAAGAKGVFYFAYLLPKAGDPGAKPCDFPAAVKEPTNSGAPAGLIYPDGRPTKQYLAMGEAFRAISELSKRLAPLRPTVGEAWLAGPHDDGTVASVLAHPQTGERLLVVASSYAGDGEQTIRVTLGPHITGLQDLASAKRAELTIAEPFRQVTVQLPRGAGAAYECEIDQGNLPLLYGDRFLDDRYLTDSINGPLQKFVIRHGGAAHVLSATHTGCTARGSYIAYDLSELLGPVEEDCVQMLLYDGRVSGTPERRGVFWSASEDGRKYEPLSANEFGKPILVKGRFLKVGMSWIQGGSWHYGHLSHFMICRWEHPARAK